MFGFASCNMRTKSKSFYLERLRYHIVNHFSVAFATYVHNFFYLVHINLKRGEKGLVQPLNNR